MEKKESQLTKIQKLIKDKRIGPYVSGVLRHKPDKIGITVDNLGWASVDALINGMNSRSGKPMSKEILDEIVISNNKKRLEYNKDHSMIRARQGHSLSHVDLQLYFRTPPDVLYHGTAIDTLPLIQSSGIKRMKRNDVHLSEDFATASQVGTRHGKLVILIVDAKKMHEDGITFTMSTNGVWLTKFVDPSYVSVREN